MSIIDDFLRKVSGDEIKDTYKEEIKKVSEALDAGKISAPELLAAVPTLLASVFQKSTDKDIENYMRHTAKQITSIIKKIPPDRRHDIEEFPQK